VKQGLRNTGLTIAATGQAVLTITRQGTHQRGRLRVTARHLAPGTTFGIHVDDVRIGTLTTNADGNGAARFNSEPAGHDQLLGVDPRGKAVTLTDDSGEDELVANVPDDTLDPADIRCCLADHEETGCDETRPEECAARGGADMGPGSCLPSPCQGTPPSGEDIRCCKAGDQGPECDTTSATECSAENGTSIGAGSCDPDPCAPTPLSDVVRCCVAGHDHAGEVECEHMTADHCTAVGGTTSN